MMKKTFVRPALITAGILLVPFLEDIYGGWAWRWPGFVVFGALLFGIALAFELAGKNTKGVAGGLVFGLAADVIALIVLHHRNPGDDIAGIVILSLLVSGLLFALAGWACVSVRRRYVASLKKVSA